MTVKIVKGKNSTTIRRVSKVFYNKYGIVSVRQGKNSIKITSDTYDYINVSRW